MQEIFQESIHIINFPFTLLFGFSLLYWLGILLGALDIGILDFDIDLDGDAGGVFSKLGHFLHLGEAPSFVVVSLLSIFLWAFAISGNYYFNPEHSVVMALLLAIPNFILSLTITGILLIPIHAAFKKLNDEESVRKDVIGEICEVTTSKVDHDSGQAEVATEAVPVLINARTANQDEIINKNQKAVIVRKNEDGTYIIKGMEE